MKTITAKELRLNLGSIAKRVQRGEQISVTYRSQPVFILTAELPDVQSSPAPGSQQATKRFLARVQTRQLENSRAALDPSVSIKDLYHRMLDQDPKYQPPSAKRK